ncbi:MAG: trypsin-like peptidase domain-containing protein [Actinomycetota bacterium]
MHTTLRRSLLAVPLALLMGLAACTVEQPAATNQGQGQGLEFPDPVPAPDTRGTEGRIVGVVRKVLPAVVNVSVRGIQGQGTGTGFVVRSDGIAVTNYHVVEGAQELTVRTSHVDDPVTYDARVIGGDAEADLAVLQIDTDDQLATVPIGDSDSLDLGQQVVAIGYALGLEGGPSVTTGIVSSLDRVVTAQDPNCQECENAQRVYDDIVQTDAAINPGNSGGPLVDLAGQVIGINTAGAGAAAAENIGFAIQINAVRDTIQNAARNPLAPAAYMGVSSADAANPEVQFDFDVPVEEGAVIVGLDNDGPAENAGVEVGDVVVGFDGSSVETSDQLGDLIGERSPGERVDVELVRADGSEDSVTVELGSRPLPAPAS